MTRQTDLAWAAGFIDADGSVMLTKRKHPRYARGSIIEPVIQATGIDRAALQRLSAILGGSVQQKPLRKDARGIVARFQTFQWRVSSSGAYEAAKCLIPYLVIKRAQAELVVQFYDEATWQKGGSLTGQRGGMKMPDAEWDRRLALQEAISGLNQRNYLERL